MASSKTGSKQGYNFPRDSDAQTKSGILNAVAGATGLPRQHVNKVVGALAALAAMELARRGTFTLPGMAKMKVVKKAATKARQGINPFTKEPTIFKAKPARKLVKIRALKGLKDSLK
jgi:DNA-binding protein HU-beta